MLTWLSRLLICACHEKKANREKNMSSVTGSATMNTQTTTLVTKEEDPIAVPREEGELDDDVTVKKKKRRKKKKRVKSSEPRERSTWQKHVMQYKDDHPELKFRDVLINAKETYIKKKQKKSESPESSENV